MSDAETSIEPWAQRFDRTAGKPFWTLRCAQRPEGVSAMEGANQSLPLRQIKKTTQRVVFFILRHCERSEAIQT